MTVWSSVPLPHGLWRDGVRHGDAALRPVTGADELFLLEEATALSKAARVTGLLARCIGRIGDIADPSPADVRALSVGDREALLLHLRRISFGSRIDCVANCPADGCGEPMDLSFEVADLLVPPMRGEGDGLGEETALADVEHAGAGWRVAYRAPAGADQETVASLARTDAAAAARTLLDRCVASITDADGSPVPRDAALPALERLLPELMSRRDPQAEIRLSLDCPACGHAFEILFDTADFLVAELAARGRSIFDEVHLIARHYHWAEAEILSLSAGRRRRYLSLIVDDLSAEGGA
ncbi:MAG: hypothetical protein ACK4QW_13475 [Alphaproteobacteria bacterium]